MTFLIDSSDFPPLNQSDPKIDPKSAIAGLIVQPTTSFVQIANASGMLDEFTPQSPRSSRKLFSKAEAESLVPKRKAVMHKGKPSIRFTPEEVEKLSEPYKFSLVAKVIDGWIDLARFRTSFARLGLKNRYSILALKVGYFLVHLSIEEDFNRILVKSEFLFAGASIKFFRWTPYFSYENESSIVPVWVNFPLIPIHLFDYNSLSSFASILGNPIAMDEATMNRTRPSHARICVEVDLEQERIYELGYLVGDYEFPVSVEYENLPKYCSKCKILGHVIGDCGRKRVVVRPKNKENSGNKLNHLAKGTAADQAKIFDAKKGAMSSNQHAIDGVKRSDTVVKHLSKPTSEWIEVGRNNKPVKAAKNVDAAIGLNREEAVQQGGNRKVIEVFVQQQSVGTNSGSCPNQEADLENSQQGGNCNFKKRAASNGPGTDFDTTNDSSNHVQDDISYQQQEIAMETVFLDAMLKTNKTGGFRVDLGSEHEALRGNSYQVLQADLQGVCQGDKQVLEQQKICVPPQNFDVEICDKKASKQTVSEPNEVTGSDLDTAVVSGTYVGMEASKIQQENYFSHQENDKENVAENVFPAGENLKTSQLGVDISPHSRQNVMKLLYNQAFPVETLNQGAGCNPKKKSFSDANVNGSENNGKNVTKVVYLADGADLDKGTVPFYSNAEVFIPNSESSFCNTTNSNVDSENMTAPKKTNGKKKKSKILETYQPPITRARASSAHGGGGSSVQVIPRIEVLLDQRDADDRVSYRVSRGNFQRNIPDLEAYETTMIYEDIAFEKAHRRKLSY